MGQASGGELRPEPRPPRGGPQEAPWATARILYFFGVLKSLGGAAAGSWEVCKPRKSGMHTACVRLNLGDPDDKFTLLSADNHDDSVYTEHLLCTGQVYCFSIHCALTTQ